MVTTVMRHLACAHPHKGFDVVCLVCDGAAEHRSHQARAATVAFKEFAQGNKEGSFSDFKVAIRHPVHQEYVFSMSDPPHIIKKIANACWH
ncbi:unnamed protein product, partial [Ectocarpus sp. 4 AP-2014]